MSSTQAPAPVIDLFSPEARNNPYPVYRALQDRDPVHWCEPLHGWLLTRFADVSHALSSPAFSPGGGIAEMFAHLPPAEREEFAPLTRHLSLWMGTLDPPVHTRIRGVMRRAFTPAFLNMLRPFIQGVTDHLLDGPMRRGEIEFISELAAPLPAMVIARLLGTPPEDCERFMMWSLDISNLIGNPGASAESVRQTQRSVLELVDYIARTIAQRRQSAPQDDLISILLAAREPGSEITEEELLANCVMLLFAGHGTITVMLSMAVLVLLTTPDVWEQLRQTPDLTPRAIEEMLRFDSPCQMIRRLAVEDVVMHGTQIRKGQMVWLGLGGANRDPDRYQDPDRFDLDRVIVPHLGYGAGIHHCLGAALSRIETEIVIRTMLRTMSHLRTDPSAIDWHPDPTARAMTQFRLAFDPRDAASPIH
jgi:pimeloyl-[acyl-carrier protein] synthase